LRVLLVNGRRVLGGCSVLQVCSFLCVSCEFLCDILGVYTQL
jgi:hypothetical protein